MRTPTLSRRTFLAATAGAAGLAAAAPRATLANAPTDNRLVVILLRGAMDGLAAVPPIGDSRYRALRDNLALDETVALDGFFALHPSLAPLDAWYRAGDLLPVHAVATPYRDRSHFDAQDVLENGATAANSANDGWLNRALALLAGGGARVGLAVGQTVPLILRGGTSVATWAPSRLPAANAHLIDTLTDLYARDPVLSRALADGLAANMLVDEAGGSMDGGGGGGRNRIAYEEMVAAAGSLLSNPDGPRVAVLELSGWDTHANQGRETGRFGRALDDLTAALVGLRGSLGSVWDRTAIAAMTEFGRTAAPNGTGGTDHGTGAVALLGGGAVAGGRVLADWPGLAQSDLHEGRDLRPTTDLRAILKGLLAGQLGLSEAQLAETVFPGSSGVMPLDGLLKG